MQPFLEDDTKFAKLGELSSLKVVLWGYGRCVSTITILLIYLVSYCNTPRVHPHPLPMLCADPTCKPARLHEGLRLQPSMPVDTANIRAYFLGCSQPWSSCKAFSTCRNIISSQLCFKLAFDQVLWLQSLNKPLQGLT